MANKVTTAGFAEMLKGWAGITGVKTIDYMGVGEGTADPAISDLALGSQVERKALAQESVDGNVMTIEAFYTTTEAISSAGISEVGLFDVLDSIGGVGFDSVNGLYPEVLHMRGKPSTAVTKDNAETMRVTVNITATNK